MDTADPSEAIKQATADVQARLELLKQQGEQISIVDMFEMQILMNKLSQLSEMSSSILERVKLGDRVDGAERQEQPGAVASARVFDHRSARGDRAPAPARSANDLLCQPEPNTATEA